MEHTERERGEVLREIRELLDTAAFSLETVRMAIGIGRCARDPLTSLDMRLQSPDEEEREAGGVAVEALEHARAAFFELAHVLDLPEYEPIGLEMRFWSSFEWLQARLFEPSTRLSGQQSLRTELVEAGARTAALVNWLELIGGRSDVPIT